MTPHQAKTLSPHTVNILQRIHNDLDCSILDPDTNERIHYGISTFVEQAIIDAIEAELPNITK